MKTNAVMKMKLEENYMKNDMMFIVKSEIRLKILTELIDKPQTIRQIVEIGQILGVPYHELIALKECKLE